MDAARRGRLLNKLADLMERDMHYLAVSDCFVFHLHLNGIEYGRIFGKSLP